MPTIKQAEIEQALDAWAAHLLNVTIPQASGELAIVGLISHGDVLARRLVQKLEKPAFAPITEPLTSRFTETI